VLYGVSDTVLDKAMFLLRAAGLTETLPGVGVYVRSSE
jgi:DNA-binding FadR family transcriptional regulator